MSALFDPALAARNTDPDTSHSAAHKAGKFAGLHHQTILTALRLCAEGATIHRLAALTGLDHVAVARRCPELERGGLIVRTNERRMFEGRTGQVWKVAERDG
jgi:predicted ArsR family transcriptional regulator